jgi:dienelactone hydrolase
MKHSSYTVIRDGELPITADFHAPSKGLNAAAVLLFLHGFKGFKDWGYFPLVAEFLTRAGFAVVRFNFSHNGTTPEHPADFADLEAFGRNTFSRELNEVSIMIDDLWMRGELTDGIDLEKIGIVGHSRGGGIALCAAHADPRIKAVATWAGVSNFEPRVNPRDLEQWYRHGVVYSPNTRTGQQMPLYYSLREDFYRNKNKLDIPSLVKSLRVPQLIVHGSADESVGLQEALDLKEWNPEAKLEIVEGANHTFGGKHPWDSKELPADAAHVLQRSISFFRENL